MFNQAATRLAGLFAVFALVASVSLSFAQTAASEKPKPPTKQTEIPWVTTETASTVKIGTPVFIRGSLVSMSPPRPNSGQPYSIFIADPKGKMRVVVFQQSWSEIKDPTFLVPGTVVDVYGKASEYQGQRQILVERGTHIRRKPGDESMGFGDIMPIGRNGNRFTLVNISAITISSVGRPVRIRGMVTEIAPSDNERIPTKFIVQDGAGKIEVVYWKEVGDAVAPGSLPKKNEPIEISGIVGEFRGALNIRVDNASHVSRDFVNTPEGQSQLQKMKTIQVGN